MRTKIKGVLVLGAALLLVISFSFGTARANSSQEDGEGDYKELLNTIDGAIRSLRLEGSVTENHISRIENNYLSAFPSEARSSSLGMEIQSFFDQNPEDLGKSDFRGLRKDVEDLASEWEGIGLSFLYEHAVFVIFGISFFLAILVNTISRTVVNWEEVNEAKRKQSELQEDLKKARREKDMKKVHKLQNEQQKFMQEHMGTMMSPMKTMLIIFIPFIIIFNVMSGIYSGWVVAWLPFNLLWPDIGLPLLSRFFRGTVASMGFFSWYLLTYFGLSQIWRKILVPSQ
ncbi:hypothetical protein AKJ55_01260 [candidate division MSBL1 archaeon SCGC-AAA382M17]|uniref:DUF106 domain-containing protein n=1 Tax=candidate division MSBL1 archaeon SCGC-AAA382M17 TaxID=1698284 RepID=A0ABR5TJF7_9EURY|nr:hypothetical protein AKJ55_01260 [candidate division MSBL1 archaeon SCGC-AAA382M17]